MRRLLPGLAAACALASVSLGQAFLTEIYINSPGTDDGFEGIEIQSAVPNYSLSGWKLLIIEGDGTAAGTVDVLMDLSAYATGANRLLSIRDSATVLVPPPESETSVVIFNWNPDIENGSNTYILGFGTLGFAQGTDLDADNDGTLDNLALWSGFTVVDAVSFAENDGANNFEYADDFGGTALGAFAGFNPDVLYRVLNCAGDAPERWVCGDVLGSGLGPFTFDPDRNFGWSEVGVPDASTQSVSLGVRNYRYCPSVPCVGDLDGSGAVDINDLTQLLSNFGVDQGATPEQGDIEGNDGDVDINDLTLLLANFGVICP